jgi:hypothetical protein
LAIHVVLKSFDGETMDHRVPDEVVIDPFLAPHVRTVDITQSGDLGRAIAIAFAVALLAILSKPLEAASNSCLIGAHVFASCGARGRIWLFRRRLLI